MPAGSEVRTRILIISDTHSALPDGVDTGSRPFRWPLPRADILLHAGDLTGNGKLEEHQRAVELLKGVDAELKIVIPGNHDLTLDYEYYQKYPNVHCRWSKYDDTILEQIEELYAGPEARAAGIRYMVEGVQTFTLKNGARFTMYTSAYQPEFYNWAFGYPRDQDRFNTSNSNQNFSVSAQAANPVPDFHPSEGIDIMLTHGPPKGILDETVRGEPVGCDHLFRAVKRCKPRLHAFGHIHEAWGGVRKGWDSGEAQELIQVPPYDQLAKEMSTYCDATGLQFGKETLFINASIMDIRYSPVQTPWLVDLMLSLSTSKQ